MNNRFKGSLVKNIASAFINGLITLSLLLIAPLGLAAVIFNTIAVTISTFLVTMVFDAIAFWLQQSQDPRYLDRPLDGQFQGGITRQNDPNYLDRSDRQ
ncbi:CRISPR-associated protein Csx18 [Cyanobacterium aponinum]|uniref:Uncharacterized protein n=1 Tax=Cyanobacterium aponinum (strain PCC 10605) TaxID=755178 RepID=K9Z8R5_CYAAP|nr:CRISPR-associated protein Csx18 [Cyanobacterium aponinum]AFZ55554.1 hypothetical protein Cyan10605_3521 [Cyanobacterium aponinum PCC 10605]